jgi:acetolactate decarboxylase
MATLNCSIPSSLLAALTRVAATGGGISHLVTLARSQYLNQPVHTLFQDSTSGALIAGPYLGAVFPKLLFAAR